MFVESLTCLMLFEAQENPNTKASADVGLSSAHGDRSDAGKKKKKGGESDKKPKDESVSCCKRENGSLCTECKEDKKN